MKLMNMHMAILVMKLLVRVDLMESTSILRYRYIKYLVIGDIACLLLQAKDTEVWLGDDQPDSDLIASPSPLNNPYSFLIEAYLIFLFMWQTVFRLSDVRMGVLLSFISVFLLIVGKKLGSLFILDFVKCLPKTLYSARKSLENEDSFVKYVCCPKCSSLYQMDDCIVKKRDGSKESSK